jgi:membrane protease YdiL (CAAX protease family)
MPPNPTPRFLDYARRGETAWWRYPLCLVLALVFTMVIGVAILLPLVVLRRLPSDFAAQASHPTYAALFFGIVVVQFAALVAGLAGAAVIVHRKRFGDLIGAWRWRGYVAGVGVWSVILVGLTLLDFAVAPKGFSYTASDKTLVLALMAIPALALQTFAEEFIFRGYITQGLLLAIKRPLPTALVSGLIFGACHIPNGLPQAAYALAFGVAMALIAIRTRGLAFGAGVHLMNNVFGAVVVVSSDDVFSGLTGVFSQHTHQLVWWDPIVGAVTLALLVALVLRPPSWLRVWLDEPSKDALEEVFG